MDVTYFLHQKNTIIRCFLHFIDNVRELTSTKENKKVMVFVNLDLDKIKTINNEI